VGEHYVAVNPSAMKVGYSEVDKTLHASMSVTLEQLDAAPKYSGPLAEQACIKILK
jgi:hypothetical protein